MLTVACRAKVLRAIRKCCKTQATCRDELLENMVVLGSTMLFALDIVPRWALKLDLGLGQGRAGEGRQCLAAGYELQCSTQQYSNAWYGRNQEWYSEGSYDHIW